MTGLISSNETVLTGNEHFIFAPVNDSKNNMEEFNILAVTNMSELRIYPHSGGITSIDLNLSIDYPFNEITSGLTVSADGNIYFNTDTGIKSFQHRNFDKDFVGTTEYPNSIPVLSHSELPSLNAIVSDGEDNIYFTESTGSIRKLKKTISGTETGVGLEIEFDTIFDATPMIPHPVIDENNHPAIFERDLNNRKCIMQVINNCVIPPEDYHEDFEISQSSIANVFVNLEENTDGGYTAVTPIKEYGENYTFGGPAFFKYKDGSSTFVYGTENGNLGFTALLPTQSIGICDMVGDEIQLETYNNSYFYKPWMYPKYLNNGCNNNEGNFSDVTITLYDDEIAEDDIVNISLNQYYKSNIEVNDGNYTVEFNDLPTGKNYTLGIKNNDDDIQFITGVDISKGELHIDSDLDLFISSDVTETSSRVYR